MVDDIVDKISKFVYWLAHQNASTSVTLMEFDEVVGELFVEETKGIARYSDKPEGELLAILRRMCDNRIYELKATHYRTHRSIGNKALSLSELRSPDADAIHEAHDDSSGYLHPEELLSEDVAPMKAESIARVLAARMLLSDFSKRVFDAVILNDDQRVAEQIRLSGIRASHVYKNGGTVKIKPWHVARAFGCDVSDVARAFREIKKVYRGIQYESS